MAKYYLVLLLIVTVILIPISTIINARSQKRFHIDVKVRSNNAKLLPLGSKLYARLESSDRKLMKKTKLKLKELPVQFRIEYSTNEVYERVILIAEVRNKNKQVILLNETEIIWTRKQSSKSVKINLSKPTPDSGESTLQDQHPLSALIIVDVQNDFIHGTLAMKDCPAKQDGEAVVPIINHLLKTVPFDVVAYTQDWHPKDHISFYENLHLRQHLISSKSKVNATTANLYDTVRFKTPIGEQVLWPTHCIQNTSGAQLHEALIVAHNSVFILKGDNSNIDSYSAFWSNQRKSRTNLDKKLKERNIRNVYIAGLALDFCVASTASHSLELNYRTFIIEDACRGVDESVMKIKVEELKKDGCEFVQADMVESLVRGFMPND